MPVFVYPKPTFHRQILNIFMHYRDKSKNNNNKTPHGQLIPKCRRWQYPSVGRTNRAQRPHT